MPIRDLAAQDASLDNDYGSTHGPNAPAEHSAALWVGSPLTPDSHEATGPGYARVSVPAAQWLPAVDGYKATATPVQFPPPTGAWPEDVTYWALLDGDVMWDCGPLNTALNVSSASSVGPAVDLAVFYDDAVTSDEPDSDDND